jgi:hypothetical protein
MIQQKKNAGGKNNSVQYADNVLLCCGDQDPGQQTVCYYQATLDNAIIGESILGVSLDGNIQYFTSPIILNSSQESLDALLEAIRDAVSGIGFTSKDISVTFNEDEDVIVRVGPSHLVFTSIVYNNGAAAFTQGCPPYSIAGFVFEDTNSDGTLNGAEAGVANVTMQLFDNAALTGTPLQTSVSDSNGKYDFTNLEPGKTYYVSFNNATGGGTGKTAVGTVPKGFDFTAAKTFAYINWVEPFNYPLAP